jgi:hypothetical protein
LHIEFLVGDGELGVDALCRGAHAGKRSRFIRLQQMTPSALTRCRRPRDPVLGDGPWICTVGSASLCRLAEFGESFRTPKKGADVFFPHRSAGSVLDDLEAR